MGLALEDDKLPGIPYFRRIDTREKEDKQEKNSFQELPDLAIDPNSPQGMGKKFEVFLEILLNRAGFYEVQRNVIYQKESRVFREVDVQYKIKNGVWRPVFVEAKYTSNGEIPYKLRDEKEKNGRIINGIDNLVTEVMERQAFGGGYQTVLATNKKFNLEVHKKAARVNIAAMRSRGEPTLFIMEQKELAALYKRLGGSYSLEKAISLITLKPEHFQKTYVYL